MLQTLYFAYGSNLLSEQMRERCPACEFAGGARLKGWKFRLLPGGPATIVPAENKTVHGVLWQLTAADEEALDGFEHVAEGWYEKRRVVLEDDRAAMTYITTPACASVRRAGYVETIRRGALAHRIPVPEGCEG